MVNSLRPWMTLNEEELISGDVIIAQRPPDQRWVHLPAQNI